MPAERLLLLSGCGGDGSVDADAGLDGGAMAHDANVAPDDAPSCVPADGATELCNELDDDCDGMVDEGFSLDGDPTNCGSCGNECRFANADGQCTSGSCEVVSCLDGFADLDGVRGLRVRVPGAFPTTTEDCNGFDDDCDGMVDEPEELPAPPADLCRTTPGTPCRA